jgi:Tfp pilus assembly protein PilF
MDTAPFRHLWFASLILFVASVAHAALPQAPTQPSAQIRDHFQRAQAALQANDSASAEREFLAVLALAPKNSAAHTGIGVLDMGRGDCRAASDEFHSALAAQPSYTKALALLGICQKRLGDGSARASLQKSFQKLRENPLRAQVGMELAGLYEQQGDTEAAGSLMRQLVQLDPENPDILFAAQRIYSDLADDTLNKLAVLAPGSARMQQAIAERLVNGGDLKSAIEHYRKALQIDPRLSGVHFELGEAILESAPGDASAEAEAQREFEAAVAIDGDTAKTECEFGYMAWLQSKEDQAMAHYQRAYQLNPNEVQAQMGLAKLLMQEKPQEAIKYLRMAVQSDPLNGSAHYQLAQAYRRLQMTDMAQKELHLFQEIKKTKDQVEAMYRQMNRQPKREPGNVPDKELLEQNQ